MLDVLENTTTPQSQASTTVPSLPHTKRGTERREALLTAADELFLQHGFDGVSLDSLVAHVGGSKASIYQYFGCKKGLLVALVQRRHECFFNESSLPTELGSRPLREVLLDHAHKIINAFSTPDKVAFMRLIVRESQRDPEIARIAYDLGPARGQATMAKMLTEAAMRGEISCPKPYESAIIYGGFLQHVKWRLLIGLTPVEAHVDMNHFIEFSIDSFLAGHQTAR